MNSSISNSKTPLFGVRHAAKIGLCLALFFGIAEFGARHYARRRAGDLSDPKESSSIGARAEQLMKQKGKKIVFVGNSAVQEGIDLPLFENLLTNRIATGKSSTKNRAPVQNPAHATMCAARGSHIKDWFWMTQNNFWKPQRQPDLFVVLFFSDMLQDTPLEDQDRGRLAQFFTTPRDWPEVFQTDVTTLGQRSEFLFSYASMLYTMRAVTQGKVLGVVAPGYEKQVLALNQTQRQQAEQQPLSNQPAPSYRALKRFLARAQKNHSKICFIAYPRNGKQYNYQVSTEVTQLIQNAGMSYIDLRQTPELTGDTFRDSIHMNDKGRPLLTHRLAQILTPVLPSK